jgi:hypothetical protein
MSNALDVTTLTVTKIRSLEMLEHSKTDQHAPKINYEDWPCTIDGGVLRFLPWNDEDPIGLRDSKGVGFATDPIGGWVTPQAAMIERAPIVVDA